MLTAVADSSSACIDPEGLDPAAILDTKCATGRCGASGLTAADVIGSGAYSVLVELTPTNAVTGEPALTHIRSALERGRHVVTSNKGPIAADHAGLVALSDDAGVALRYEATVCGAIPVIHAIRDGLAGNVSPRSRGVLYGAATTF